MALGITFGKIAISLLSAYAIVYFRFPFRMFFFWMIFITLMLPVEVRILPTYDVIARLGMLNSYIGPDDPADRLGHGDLPLPAVLPDDPRRADGGRAHRPGGADPLLLRHPAAAVRTNIAALFIILFIYGWNQYLWPLLITTDTDLYTVVMGIQRMVNTGESLIWHLVMGTAILAHGAAGGGGAGNATALREGPGGKREITHGRVTLSNVGKTYPGGVTAVTGADFAIADGEFIVLVGPSGCGKSTILRMIAGLEAITEGEVSIGGRRGERLEPGERDIAMVFQNYALYPHMSVRKNMEYGLKNQGMPKPEIAEADRRGRAHPADRAISRPQAPRAFGRAAPARRHGPRHRARAGVFLFDEPLSNLDAKLRTQLRAELKDLHTRLGATFVFVTHDQVEAMSLADRIVIMSEGKVEQIGTPMELYRTPASRFVAEFIGAPPMNVYDLASPGGQALAATGRLRAEGREACRHPPRSAPHLARGAVGRRDPRGGAGGREPHPPAHGRGPDDPARRA
jgi:sn-glycerol 3-phosphate transport system ATP-binding protein